jgi:hypothetical protein
LKCVEFESRLNDLLDERRSPGRDRGLSQHAEHCAGCADLLAAHDVLLDGVAALPAVRLRQAEQQAFVHRIVAEVGNTSLDAFRPVAPLGLAEPGAKVLARNPIAKMAIVGVILATAAALLIALLPRPFGDRNQGAPAGQPQQIVESSEFPSGGSNGVNDYQDLALIARVGYEVADGLTPVTNSMVTAYREWRKRPFFKSADEPQRSSFYVPRMDHMLA